MIKIKHRNKRAIYFVKHKELSLLFLMKTRRWFIPAARAIEIEYRRYKSSKLEEKTLAFVHKYLKPRSKESLKSKTSPYSRINRLIFKRLVPLYFELVCEKLLEGHSVVLPAGMGTLQIMDISPATEYYSIALRGQCPALVITNLPKKTRENMKNNGYDFLLVKARPKFTYIMQQYIIQGTKYPKIQKRNNGKHEIHKPLSNTYITGKDLQRQAVR